MEKIDVFMIGVIAVLIIGVGVFSICVVKIINAVIEQIIRKGW